MLATSPPPGCGAMTPRYKSGPRRLIDTRLEVAEVAHRFRRTGMHLRSHVRPLDQVHRPAHSTGLWAYVGCYAEGGVSIASRRFSRRVEVTAVGD